MATGDLRRPLSASYDTHMTTATVTNDGAIEIPADLRERMGIAPGDRLELACEGDRLVATRAETTVERLSRFVGVLDLGMTTDEFLEELRGPRGPL